ncbi:MAG TPA: hypothetical protein VKX17_09930 [Planctomycetota bacterium]|nr:hypothetical protein [Planctomycetota bacterium]
MSAVTLKAHFDGAHIVLDEPYALPRNSALVVTVLPAPAPSDIDEDAWLRAAATSDAFDFLADAAEDIYTLNDGEPFVDAV